MFDCTYSSCNEMIVEDKKKKIKSILITGTDLYNLNDKINEFYKTITLDQFQYFTEIKNDGVKLYTMIGISD